MGDLGLRFPLTVGALVAWLAVAGILWFLWRRVRAARRGARPADPDALEAIDVLIPRTSREHRWATWTAINAGVTEEIVARGYLLWYLQQFVGPWTAWGLAVLVFTFAHIYQGPRHLPGIAVASATLVGLFLLAGSLWPVMVLHIVGDLLQLAGLSEARMKHGAAARDGSERSGPSALPA